MGGALDTELPGLTTEESGIIDVPLYNGDVGGLGAPPSVTAPTTSITEVGGLVLVTLD